MSPRFHVPAVAAIGLVCILAYGSSLDGEFVLDDEVIIARNEHIRSPANIGKLFGMDWWGMTSVEAAGALYRPLTAATYAVDIWLMGGESDELRREDRSSFGLDVRYFHTANIFYHASASVMVYFLILQFFSGGARAFLAAMGAMLFAAHPVHVEAVASLVGRAEVLAGMFVFAAGALFLWANRERDRVGIAIIAAGLWLAGLLSKEMAVPLPVALIAVEWVRGRRRSWRRWLMVYAPFAVAAVIYLFLRFGALGDEVFAASYQGLPSSKVSFGRRFMTMTHAFAVYLKLMLVPISLSPDYTGFPICASAAGGIFRASLLCHVLLIGFGSWALLWGRGHRTWLQTVGMGILGFYLLALPVSNVFLNTGVIVSERAMYIPSVAVILLLVALGSALTERTQEGRSRLVPAAIGTCFVVVGIVACRAANKSWADEESLFRTAIRNKYCGHLGHSGMARVFMKQGEYESALLHAERSIRLRPTAVNLQRKADCLLRLGRDPEAADTLEILLRNRVSLRSNVPRLAEAYVRLERTNQARTLLDRYPEFADDPRLKRIRDRLNTAPVAPQ